MPITKVPLAGLADDVQVKLSQTNELSGQFKADTLRSSRTSEDARNTGFQLSSGTDIGECNRSSQYYDDRANNCNGYLGNGNCHGNPQWNPPNGNWWEWGLGIGRYNPGYDFAGGYSDTLQPIGVSFNYDGYYQAADEIGGLEYRRNYRNCNCGTFNCITNCNCNCNCNCACTCSLAKGTLVEMADGTFKRVEDVKEGETVKSVFGEENKVVGLIECPVGADETTYTINGSVRMTGEHLVWTGAQWGAVSLEGYTSWLTKRRAELGDETVGISPSEIKQLQVGDVILLDNKMVRVESLEAVKEGAETLYSFDLDGDKTFKANGFGLEAIVKKGK